MSALKDQDPDYGPSDASDEKHQRIFEENGTYVVLHLYLISTTLFIVTLLKKK